MSLSYPENTIWYIEARPWSGTEDNSGFVQAAPVTQGSGVVVTFIKVLSTGERAPRSYILTCAHVVRDRDDLLLEDIICYPPGKGFVGTADNTRRSGEGVAKARTAIVSKYSPCKGERGSRPEAVRNESASDWVLLEIDHPSFRNQPSVQELRKDEPSEDQLFQVIGFPGGASTWEDGDIVDATIARDFRLRAHSKPGMIAYEGPEETRSGMSGCGIFDDAGALVGIHRSNTDSVMKRGGIRADVIARHLRSTYQIEFASKSLLGLIPENDHPVVELTRPIKEQLQLFAEDKISFVGSPTFNNGEQIWLGHHWEDAKPDKTYTVWGIPGQPITPRFRNLDLDQPFTVLKLEISFTRYRDKPRDLRDFNSGGIPKK